VRPQSVSNFDDGEEDVAGRDSRGRLIVPSFPAKKQSVDEDGSSVKDAVSTFVPTHTMKKTREKFWNLPVEAIYPKCQRTRKAEW
jgi:hypothetical protein